MGTRPTARISRNRCAGDFGDTHRRAERGHSGRRRRVIGKAHGPGKAFNDGFALRVDGFRDASHARCRNALGADVNLLFEGGVDAIDGEAAPVLHEGFLLFDEGNSVFHLLLD